MQIKKGNQVIMEIGIKDINNDLITDLNTATEIKYMIKTEATDADIDALVTVTLTAGGIVIDTPEIGYVQVTIDAPDTESLDPGNKYHALQIEYSSDNIQEINFEKGNRLQILQDVIR